MIEQLESTTGLRLAPWPGLELEAPAERPEVGSLFLDVAASIGGQLCRDALWAEGRCAWMGQWVHPGAGRSRTCHTVFGPDLYLGSAGVGLFLARLAAHTGEKIVRRTASAALWRSLESAERIEPVSRPSLYSGWTGLALAGLAVAEALDEEALRGPSLELVRDVTSMPREQWDLLGGVAGAIPTLLRIHDTYDGHMELGAETLIDQALELGDHLLERAIRSDQGLSWGDVATGVSTERVEHGGPFGNLTGFSHGAGGVGWALAELYATTGEKRFAEAASEAFRYERHWYDTAKQNWLDLRDPAVLGTGASEPTCMRGWCHGAGGVALSRLRSWQILGDETLRDEAEIAVETSRTALEPGTELSQNNYCLCHGLGGNAESLLYGAKVFDRPDWRRAAEDTALRGVEEVHAMRLPWPCGTQDNVEIPSLFVGLAGIGYFYLRLFDDATPSVLILPAPLQAAEAQS